MKVSNYSSNNETKTERKNSEIEDPMKNKSLNRSPKHILVLRGTTPHTKLSVGDLQLTKFLKPTVEKVKAVKRTKQNGIAVRCNIRRQVATFSPKT